MRYLLLIFLLLDIPLSAKIVYSGRAKPGYSIVVDIDDRSFSVEEKVQIQVIAISPEGYHINRSLMRRNLLDDLGYGPPPFSLLAEETIIQEHNIQRIIYTLDPELPGNHSLSFGKVVFEPDEKEKLPPVEFMSGTFSLSTDLPNDETSYKALPAPLMDLSMVLPVNLSQENRETYLENEKIFNRELEKHRKIFPKRGESTIAFALLLGIKLIVAMLAIWQMVRKKEIKKPKALLQLSAREKAVQSLQQLTVENKEHYHVKTSDVIRTFLKEVADLHLPTMTTTEFTNSEQLTDSQKKLVSQFLKKSDRIKFAKVTPSEKSCEETEQAAQTIIHQFVPQEPKEIMTQGVAFWGFQKLLKNFYRKFKKGP